MTNVYILGSCTSFFTVHVGILLCCDDFGSYSCYNNDALRQESVMDAEPDCGSDTSRTHRVARKCVAAVTDGHPWCTVQCQAASSVGSIKAVSIVRRLFGDFVLPLVDEADQSLRCLDMDSWSYSCHSSLLPHFRC